MSTMSYKNNNKEDFQPSVFSRMSYANSQSEVDQTKIGFTFWNGLLKISIAPFNPQTERYDYDNEGSIYLSSTKADVFANEIRLFMEDPAQFNNVGVATNKGIISLSNGKNELGEIHPLLTIRGINNETGEIEYSYTYDFNRDYHYSIRNYEEGNKFDKHFHNDIEVLGLLRVLEEYVQSSVGAYAYANIDMGRFNNSRINTKLDSICENLGIQYNKGGKGKSGGGSKGSIFDKAPAKEGSVDDIDDLY